jgi:hypothetical protein
VLRKFTAGPPVSDQLPLVAFVVDAWYTTPTLSSTDWGPDNETVGAAGGGGGGGVVACVAGGGAAVVAVVAGGCVTGTAVVGGADDVVLAIVDGTGAVDGKKVVGAAACFEPFLL